VSNFVRSRVVLLLAAVIACGCVSSFAQDRDRIVGAWNYTALAFCDNGVCDTGMFAIHADGTVVGYDNLSGTSPTIGTWRAIDRFTYKMKTKNAVFRADGTIAAFILAIGTVTLSEDGKTFNYNATIKVSNPDGSLRFEAPSPLTATRF
jgi:hypothetical protein